jgi:alkaline phosphatase D
MIRSRQPAALLLYGDIAAQDRKDHFGLLRADYLLRDFMPAWQSLAAAVPVLATWDDHDYYANDISGTKGGISPEILPQLWNVWRQNWNNPAYGFGEPKRGVFLRTRLGPCDVIMTDNRYFRGNGEAFLGEDQLKWLEAQLLDCKGPFIIISCGTMWSDYVNDGKDSWGKFDPKGRERIFKFIEDNRIAGVLLISGDRHGARGFRIPRPPGFNFYEFEVGSLGGRHGPPETDPAWTTQFYHLVWQYAFGEFTIDAAPVDPTVTFRLIREDGRIMHELTLERSQLTPPAR